MMIYNRLGYEIKRSDQLLYKNFIWLKTATTEIYPPDNLSVLTGNKVHLSEIARSLKKRHP